MSGWQTAPIYRPGGGPPVDAKDIRGAMWSVRAPVAFGPRPGQPDNIFATDYLEWYSPEDQELGLSAYLARGYKHAVSGPPIDTGGYHGQFPTEPGPMTQAIWDRQMDALEKLESVGLCPIFFLHPDGWSFEQTRDVFTPYLQQPRSQALIRIIVPTGWEPTRYDWSSYTWAKFCQWARELLPNALVMIHTVSDVDAPVGVDENGDDNKNPNGNADGWARVSPHIHGWLIQNGPYDSAPDKPPASTVGSDGRTLAENFKAQFLPDGLGAETHSVAWHWATGIWKRVSAWGDGIPPLLYNAECTAYNSYWHNLPEEDTRKWGDLALAQGAWCAGFLDGGHP